MNTLREAVHDYLALRRGLGFKLRIAGPRLFDFVAFLEREDAPYITNELALRWAMHRIDLAGPVAGARIDFDDLEALVTGNRRSSKRGGVVGAPIEGQHDA